MRPNRDVYERSAEYLRRNLPKRPELSCVLGSGLSAFAYGEHVRNRTVIPYEEIPGFPVSTVSFHKGELVFGDVGGRSVLFFSGRFHYYEGWEMWQCAYPASISALLGIRGLVLTNAVGGIRQGVTEPGDLFVVRDHIKLCADSPCRGANDPAFGPRFFDMQSVYDPAFRECARRVGEACGIPIKEGVFGYMTGPQFETAAEIRALSVLGADLVGMSTVPEAIEAAHCGLPVLVLACVTNSAAGVTGAALSEEEVLETGERSARTLAALFSALLPALPLRD